MPTPHLLAWALSTPWAMRPEAMAAYALVLAAHQRGGAALGAALAAHTPQSAASVDQLPAAGGLGTRRRGTAIIYVMGPIVEWSAQIDMCEGGTSARQVATALQEVEHDDTITGAMLVFSTPGGSVYGVEELGATINRVKAKKPIFGVAQSLAASAGYWLLSQCTEAYCSPGGEVGSIGVYSGHEDIGKAMEMAGVRIELFSAGKYKTEGHPFGPMSKEAKAYQVKRAHDYYGAFTRAVATGRGVSVDSVRDGMGQGRVLGAEAALRERMIDGIATAEQVLDRLQRGQRAAPRPRAAAATAAPRPMLAQAQRDLARMQLDLSRIH